MGREYLIEHCKECYRDRKLDEAYRAYVTDALRVIAENTSHVEGGKYINQRCIEMIESKRAKPNSLTAEEIIGGIKAKLKKLSENP